MTACFLGIDIGSVALKGVLLYRGQTPPDVPDGFSGPVTVGTDRLWFSPYVRTKGKPYDVAMEFLASVRDVVGSDLIGVRLTGSAAAPVAGRWGVVHENEFIALGKGVGGLCPEARTVFEMGGETSKYLRLEPVSEDGHLAVIDYDTNGDCAAGTGSFLDQQAGRLGFEVERIGDIVGTAERMPKIAGRCSVFAKSDMIHAQQKGYGPDEVLAGLCEAVARNFRAAVAKNRQVVPTVLFVGGVSANSAVVDALRSVFGLEADQLIVPPYNAWMSAAGTAIAEAEAKKNQVPQMLEHPREGFVTMDPLCMDKVVLLRDRIPEIMHPIPGERRPVYLGVDVGSVSTNLAVIDDEGCVLWELYVRTRARPIEVVGDGLRKLKDELGDRIEIVGVGTTGSGRELIGQLIGADTINDEITAHRSGATFIAEQYMGAKVDTILEIGGQDSKYIRLEDDVVVDFTMNDACAAGTGSFLEERAVEVGVSIKDEFAELALSSRHPIRLGERCTVFMERDVFAHLSKGAPIPDIVAGLAYSVVQNYINRVVRGRPIDGVVFFQGGTAYNDAVAAAFAGILDREIVIPPYNGVIGAIGASLLARDWAKQKGENTRFRGYSLDKVEYSLREFTCKGCQNFCNMQEFTVEGERSFWGDQCSDRFRTRQKTGNPPVVQDLFGMYLDSLPRRDLEQGGPVIGLPRSMYNVELLPFWYAFFERLGWSVVLTPPTNKSIIDRGLESTVAEPCLPIQVAHGHVDWLLNKQVDAIFLPAIIDRPTPFQHTESYVCVWGQTLPFVLRASPSLSGLSELMLSPVLRMREKRKKVVDSLTGSLARFGVSSKMVALALEAAESAQAEIVTKRHDAGSAAMETLRAHNRSGIVLVGRPYNVYDRRINLDVPAKLRDYYGIDVIPIDFIDLDSVDIRDINANMYWNYGRKIIAAAKITKDNSLLNLIYVTNFKCGPDSFIKHFITEAGGKPFLTLQFDGHSNDAGIMTRCEAFLESKGMLRTWSGDNVGSPKRESEAA